MDNKKPTMYFMVEDMWKTLQGNGRPGLVDRVTRIESAAGRRPVLSAAVTASIISALAAVLVAVL